MRTPCFKGYIVVFAFKGRPSMLKFKRFGGHAGANGAPSGVAKFNDFGTVIVAFGSGEEEVGEVREMAEATCFEPGSSVSRA